VSDLLQGLNGHPLSPEILNKLAWVFDGSPKAIHRNSGGLIQAHPAEVVFPESTKQVDSEVRVKMVFYELERDNQHRIISKKIITSSKTVPLSEIKEGFDLQSGIGGFVVDFGLGLIPVHFISSYVDQNGFEWALAARQDEYEKAKLSNKAEEINLFEIPKKMLRWIEPLSLEGKKDFQWAKNHLASLVSRKEQIIPNLLLVAESCRVSPSLSVKEIDERLRDYPEKKRQAAFELEPLNENLET